MEANEAHCGGYFRKDNAIADEFMRDFDRDFQNGDYKAAQAKLARWEEIREKAEQNYPAIFRRNDGNVQEALGKLKKKHIFIKDEWYIHCNGGFPNE